MKALHTTLLLLLSATINAQTLVNYAVARNTSATYNSISASGNSFGSWRNNSSNTQDDNRSDFTNIGFDFWYDGVRYTQFCVSTNGFLDFSSSTNDGGPVGNAFGYDNTAFTAYSTANGTRPAIAPFYDDLTAQGNVAPLGNSLKYDVSGTAPNRTLTVEWINMAVYQNVTPSLNFQVKLVESSGVIIINYGTMNTGTKVFSYTMGMNGPTLSLFPTAAQLKLLQTVNGNTYNNTAQNNLSAMPAANSQYIFTPPVPTAVSGGLSFTGVSQTAMTLNWSNWASNEVGYVIYNSTDGVNYDFVSQTAVNATSATIGSLLPATTYYWKVYAVTEGCLSSPVSGSQTTNPAGNKISNQTGNWNTASIWTPNGVPTAADNVTIANGHIVTINTSAQCNNLTVGQGSSTTLRFNGGTARTITVNNNITVAANASFLVTTNSNTTHNLNLEGNIVNSGTIDFAPDANSLVNTSFTRNGNQTISGTGSNNFSQMTVNLGNDVTNVLEVTASNFAAASDFLNLTSGTFKLSTVNTVNLTPFNTATSLPANSMLWLNSNKLTVNTNNSVTLLGQLTISNGTLNIGNASNEDLVISGGNVSVLNGALNIAGKLDGSDINNPSNFNLIGGMVVVPTVGSSNTSIAPFHISGAGSECNLTGGLLVIQREGGSGQHLGYTNIGATGAAVTGGTLQIGNSSTPSGNIIDINTDAAVNNLLVNSSNATARLNTNNLSVTKDITIAAGTLNANNLNLSLGGNWSDAGTFTTGTGAVTFNSASAQSIYKSGGETFNSIYFGGSGAKTFSAPVTAKANFSISTGASVDVSTSNYSLTVKGNFTNNGLLNTQTGSVTLNGTTSQSIGGSSVTDFYNLTLNNTAGATLSGAENLVGTLNLNNGTLNTSGQAFTMISNASGTARIAPITGSGDITGNVPVQRYIPGGATGWALLGNPISSVLTMNDWNDNFFITCPTCPDGNAAGFTSIYSYDETATGLYDSPSSYVPIFTINDAMINGKGYWVYLGTNTYTTTALTMDVTGTVRKFNYTIPLSRTNTGSPANDGWNLIYNPYPSPISWNALRAGTANLDNAIYVYNADLNSGTGGFASYVNGISSPAIGSGGIGDDIPMCEGFYVHSTGATGLSAKETNKIASAQAFLKTSSTTANAAPLLRLNMNGPSNFTDETLLYFQTTATDTFDTGYDAYKMRGQDPYAPSIALETGTVAFQVNGIAPINGNYSSALKTLTGYSGSYTISASNINSFPTGACINLYDKFTGTTTDLRNSNYIFTLEDTTTVARFLLSITLNSLSVAANVKQPTCTTPGKGSVHATGGGAGPWNYYWKLNGVPVHTSLNKAGADSVYNISSGLVELQVNTTGQCDNNSAGYVIAAQSPAKALFNSVDTVFLDRSPTAQFNNTSLNGVSFAWDFGTGQDFSNSVSPAFTYSAPGIYQVRLLVTSSSGCQDSTGKTITVLDETTGIQELSEAPGHFLLKTLENNLFVLQPEFKEAVNYSAQLSDPTGRMLANYKTGAAALKVDLTNYPGGVYLLRIFSDKGNLVLKLPVQ